MRFLAFFLSILFKRGSEVKGHGETEDKNGPTSWLSSLRRRFNLNTQRDVTDGGTTAGFRFSSHLLRLQIFSDKSGIKTEKYVE